MRLVITRVGSDVLLSDPSKMRFHLVVEREDGTEFPVPVPQETADALMAEVARSGEFGEPEHQEQPQPATAPSLADEEQGQPMDPFHGEVEPSSVPTLYDPDGWTPPESEDEVPSV